MSAGDPEEIREEIERTRDELSRDVDALRDKVSPGQVARRQADRLRAGVARVKDRVRHSEDETGPDEAALKEVGPDETVPHEAAPEDLAREDLARDQMARDENAWRTDRRTD